MSAVDTASRFLLNKSARVLIGLVYGLLLIACATPTPTLQTDRECHPGIDAAVQTGDWETARLAHERLLAENPDNCLALVPSGMHLGADRRSRPRGPILRGSRRLRLHGR